mgnify:FL=1
MTDKEIIQIALLELHERIQKNPVYLKQLAEQLDVPETELKTDVMFVLHNNH